MNFRYRTQFVNGSWKLFDTHAYRDVASFSLLSVAMVKCQAANRRAP